MKINYKKNAAFILSLIMTAYSVKAPAMNPANTNINAVETQGKAESETDGKVISPAADTKAAEEIKVETADIYVENVVCAGGDTVKVSVGLVDWTQDIATAGIVLEFDGNLTLENTEALGELETSVSGNEITVSGKLSNKEAYRGRLAVLTFSVPEVDKLSMYRINVKSASLTSSTGKEFAPNFSYGLITADSSLKPSELSFSEVNSASVNLCWNMKKNTDKIAGYIIYRNGEEIARTEEKEFFDSNLETGKEYKYSVQAYGDDNYISPVSAEITAVPAASVITGISFTKTAGSLGGDEAQFRITMDKDTHIKSASIYSIDQNGNECLINSSEEGIFLSREYIWDLSKVQSGKYAVRADITDIDGAKISMVSDFVTVDKGAPDAVEQFSAFSDEECVRLSWGRGNQLNITGYNIYRKTEGGEYSRIYFAEGIDTLSYTDNTAENGVLYYYNITAVNAFGQEGEMTEAVSAISKADETAPVISTFLPEKGSTLSGTVDITARASDGDGVGVKKIVFSISEDDGNTWKVMNETEGDNAVWQFDTSAYITQTVQIKVFAEDNNGNISKENINKYSVDNKAPEKVTGLALVEAYDTYATISWNDVSDNDLKYFIAECTNQKTGEKKNHIIRTELGVHINNLSPDTQYSVVVYAVDDCGNVSEASDSFEFVTVSDSHSPHIISVTPAPGCFRDSLSLKVTAEDNISVSKISIEVSSDNETYESVAEMISEDTASRFTAEYVLDLASYSDGMLYIKFTAYDADGLTDELISEYMVDTSKPEKVKNVQCNTGENQIEVTWDDYEDERIACYKIFRKTEESEDFELIKVNDKDNRYCNYFDRDIEPGKTYIYKVSAVDEAGNESELSDECTGMVESDTKKPEMYGIYPDSGLSLNKKNNFVRVCAHDNICLSKIVIEYYCGDEEKEYEVLGEKTVDVFDDAYQTEFPEELLFTGNTIHVRAYAVDKAGNQSDYITADYTVDVTETRVTNCTVNSDNGTVTVTWEAEEADTTAGYEVYKRVENGDYQYVGRVYYDASCGGKYTYTETNIADAGKSWYRIIAYNTNFNKTVFDCEDGVDVLLTPNASIGCEAAMERNKEYVFDASGSNDVYGISRIVIDYGDGTVESCTSAAEAIFKHRYSYNGVYSVKLTVFNTKGLSSEAVRIVEVTEGQMIGTVNIKVKTTEGKSASNIAVYCDVGTSYQKKMFTDENGRISFQTTAGVHAIGVYGDGYLPDIRNCSVMSGAENNFTFSVVEEDIIEASFDVQRMTLDEIKAVGINLEDKGNQHILKLNVRLVYGPEQPVNLGGYCYGGGGNGLGVFAWAGEPPQINVKGKGGEERKIQPVSVSVNSEGEVEQVIVIDLPVEASYLKEFFDVKLHIINNASSEFSVTNNVITLNIPDGLKLIESSGYDKLETVIGEIKGGTQETVQWILRGDKEGSYKLSADYKGYIPRFNEDLSYSFESDEIKVYGEKAASVDVAVENKIEKNEMYVKVTLDNTSPVDIYNAGAIIKGAASETFGKANSGLCCTFVRSEIISPYDSIGFSSEDIDILPSGFKFAVLYHLTNISPDMVDENTGEMINFHERVSYLIDTKLNNMNDSGIHYTLSVHDSVCNRYNHSNDEENFKRLTNENSEYLEALTDSENIEAAKLASELRAWEFATNSAEYDDDILNFILDAGFDDLKDVDKREYINQVIYSLLVSEEVQNEIADEFMAETIEGVSEIVDNTMVKYAEMYGDGKDYKDAAKEILFGDKNKIMTAMKKLKDNGIDDFINYAGTELSASIGNVNLNGQFKDSFKSLFVENVTDTVIELGIDVKGGFDEAWANYLSVNMYRAVNNEAQQLLGTLAESAHDDNLSVLISTMSRELLLEMQGNIISDAGFAVLDVCGTAAESVISSYCSDFIGGAIGTAGGSVGSAVYIVAGIAYDAVAEDIDNKYLYPAKVVIVDSMCDSIKRDLDKFITEGNYSSAMKYVEYLTKLRVQQSSDSKAFIYSFKNGKFDIEYITTPQLRVLYEYICENTKPEVLSEYIARIQRNSDILFMPSTNETSHQWEDVGYDYVNGVITGIPDGTNLYEYRIDEGAWQEYKGKEKISFKTDDKSHILQIRRKDVVIDSVKTIRINAREYLEGDLSVKYADNKYEFSSTITGNNLKVLFSNEKEVSDGEWVWAKDWSGEDITLYRQYKYVHIRKAADYNSPESLTRTVAVISTVSVDAGRTTGGTVSGMGEYKFGDVVTLTASPSGDYVFAGWYNGDTIVCDSPEYSFRAYTDVSLTARFLSKGSYTVKLSSNVEQAVNQYESIDGAGMIYLITSECSDENYKFSYWEDENGDIVSFLQSFPFVVEGETVLRAVYEKVSG